ncbi:MAG: hypothetical protein PWQ37_2901 [Candidatus Petromonas sp.]|nr:hypothetical protein [Candidatus Petromonas sp.]
MMLFYLWINSKLDILSLATNILVSTIFGLLGFMMPFLFLQILSEAMKEKIKKSSIDFLITFKNFLIILEKADIFDAFERTVEFLSEPLRSFVEIMVYERKKYKLNAIKCLNNFKEKLDNPDLHLFIENLKLCYIHGGDYIALTDEFIDEIGKINDIDDEENTEDMLLNMGLYFLLLINFGVIYFILHSKFKYEVLGNKLGSLIFILDFIIAIYIVIMTIKKPQDI